MAGNPAELAALAALPSTFPPALRNALRSAIESSEKPNEALAELLSDEALVARARTYVVGGPLDARVVYRPRQRAKPSRGSGFGKAATIVTMVVGALLGSARHLKFGHLAQLARDRDRLEVAHLERNVQRFCDEVSEQDCEHARAALEEAAVGSCKVAAEEFQAISREPTSQDKAMRRAMLLGVMRSEASKSCPDDFAAAPRR